MSVDEWVYCALQRHDYDPEKARESLRDLGEWNPPLVYYQESCAIAARERWAELLSSVDMNSLHERQWEITQKMGPLWRHLRPDDAASVRIEAERRWRVLHPRPFTGFKEKCD